MTFLLFLSLFSSPLLIALTHNELIWGSDVFVIGIFI